MSISDHVSTACAFGASMATNNKWTISGEWTGAQTDCALWLNGRGVGARYGKPLYQHLHWSSLMLLRWFLQLQWCDLVVHWQLRRLVYWYSRRSHLDSKDRHRTIHRSSNRRIRRGGRMDFLDLEDRKLTRMGHASSSCSEHFPQPGHQQEL